MKDEKPGHKAFSIYGLSLLLMILASISCNEDEPEIAECNNCLLFDHNGTERSYYLHVPGSIDEDTMLLFILHGYHGDATEYAEGFEGAAKNIVTVAPQGLPDKTGVFHWNAGFDAEFSEVDDTGFLSALAQELGAQYNIDASKVFASGVSNGGWMSYHLVYKRPDIFKGAASIIGRMGGTAWKNRAEIVPVPVLQISGSRDELENDYSDDWEYGWFGAPDMPTQIEFWTSLNATGSSETIQITSNTRARKYTNGINGNQVWYYVVNGLGHEVPRGERNRIDAYELVYEFFIQF